MRLVVADTGPIHYLVLIGKVDILPVLFEKVYLPTLVRDEMIHVEAPQVVRDWANHPPAWAEVRPAPTLAVSDSVLASLDDGEKAAISLAISLKADLILMDDREGASVARQKGFAVTGTLGILDLASNKGLLDLEDAFNRLKGTNFRYPQTVMDMLLARQKKSSGE